MKHIIFFLIIAAGCCITAGCGGPKNVLPTLVVKGVVTLDGVPTEGISITFNPTDRTRDNAHSVAAGGVTGKDGKYTLTSASNPLGSGALVGEYIPTFSKCEFEEREPTASPEEEIKKYGPNPPKRIYIVPAKYDDVKTCGIAPVKVEKGSTVFDFELTTK